MIPISMMMMMTMIVTMTMIVIILVTYVLLDVYFYLIYCIVVWPAGFVDIKPPILIKIELGYHCKSNCKYLVPFLAFLSFEFVVDYNVTNERVVVCHVIF